LFRNAGFDFRMTAALLVLAAVHSFAGEPASTRMADPAALSIKRGRELFKERRFIEALDQFALALTLKPDDRDTAFLAGVSAYWARMPERAIEFYNELLDTAPRNSQEEWKLETQRIMALYQLNQIEVAEQVAERIYELRQKVPALKSNDGFVREHLFVRERVTEQQKEGAGVVDMQRLLRIGCYEVFDDRKEAQNVYAFPITVHSAKDDPLIKRLVVTSNVLPSGEAGYILTEEGAEDRTVFKRWLQRPPYAEVRALVLQALKGEVQPLEQKKKPEALAPSAGAPPSADAPPFERVFTNGELAAAAKIAALALDAKAAQILTLAGRLREVDLDITRLTRLSLSDPAMAERYLGELKTRAPYSREDAAELVDLISKAKPDQLAVAFEKLPKIGPRRPYLDYVLLTGLNTRGADFFGTLLKECQRSADFMVRHTAALMLARGGDKKSVAQLIKELETADELACSIVQDSLVELLGNVIGKPPPGSDLALSKWKADVAQWWQHAERKFTFAEQRRNHEPYWVLQK